MAEDSSSTASSSTAGRGVSFDELCSGTTKNYSFNVINLKKKNFQQRVDSLIQRIKDTITELEFYSSRKVEKFTIGKTFAPARARTEFDPKNEDTWRADGISSRWHKDYIGKGYDGLVVVGAVSRKMLTDTSYRDTHNEEARMCNTKVWDQQSYALALESALICHYAFKTFDPRLANDSFYPGKKKKTEEDKEEDKAAAGGIVYFAFKYEQTANFGDPRLANSSLHARKNKQIEKDEDEDKAAAGGIVYFPFKYEQTAPSSHEQNCQYSPNKRIIGSSTSQKHRNFVSDRIIKGKDVTELAGIGEVLGGRLKERGFAQASDVHRKFLSFKKDQEKFMDWLNYECGANRKQSGDCYNCLKEWSDKFL